jgi:hypothetical protein
MINLPSVAYWEDWHAEGELPTGEIVTDYLRFEYGFDIRRINKQSIWTDLMLCTLIIACGDRYGHRRDRRGLPRRPCGQVCGFTLAAS